MNDPIAFYKKPPSFVKSQKVSVRSSYTLRYLVDSLFIRLFFFKKRDSTQCLTNLFTRSPRYGENCFLTDQYGRFKTWIKPSSYC